MLGILKRYAHWLHTQWPSGTVERLPEVNEDGSTAVPGLFVVGDLTGIPLLKFSSDTGARVVRTIVDDAGFQNRSIRAGVRDLAMVRCLFDLALYIWCMFEEFFLNDFAAHYIF